MTPQSRLVREVDGTIERFADELIAILRATDLNELLALSGRTLGSEQPGVQTPPPAPVRRAPAAPSTPVRKRPRSWPRCSEEGCSAKMYPPSGANRLCYRHHLAAGGEPSPLLRKKAIPMPEPKKPPRPAKPKTILRKKSETERSSAPRKEPPAPKPAVVPSPDPGGGAPPSTQRNKALDAAEGLFNFGGDEE